MKRIISVLLVLAYIFCLSGCKTAETKTKYTDYSFDSFDTVTTIVGYEPTKEKFDDNCKKIKNLLMEYHKLYTIYNRYDGLNNLCTVNQVVGGEHKPAEVDAKIIDLLIYAKEMYDLTDGKVNVAMGSVLNIWHQYRNDGLDDPENAKLPPMDLLNTASAHTDINNMIIDADKGTVYLADAKMRLDVGAVAKGYAVQKVAEWMQQQGMSGYVLNVGGNVKTVGNRPQGEKWKVGIENPDTENEDKPYIEYLELSHMSLVTSGSYQRFYTVQGKNYHHIIDPATLMPAEYFMSVSVLCPDSAKADALSTALFCMSFDEGKKLIESISDAEAMWVLPDGSQQYSSGFKKYCVE